MDLSTILACLLLTMVLMLPFMVLAGFTALILLVIDYILTFREKKRETN